MSFIKITEQDSFYNDLERKSVRELLEDINTENQKVALAVRRTIPKIEELVLQIVPLHGTAVSLAWHSCATGV